MANTQVTTRDTQLEKQRIAKNQISLTNFANTSEPAIAAGSVVEVGGALYVFSSDEAITGWSGVSNDTDAYIKLVPGVSLVTAEFVEAAPTWSDSKQGWYNGNDRYVAGLHRGVSAAEYESKWIYQKSQDSVENVKALGSGVHSGNFEGSLEGTLDGGVIDQNGAAEMQVKVIELGDWNMDSTQVLQVSLGGVPAANVRQVHVIIRDNDDNFRTDLLAGTAGAVSAHWRLDLLTDNNLELIRDTGGAYDNANFNSTSYNRGWATIWYEA